MRIGDLVMPGICAEAADPNQHSLRFRPHGAAYECWTGLIYGFTKTPTADSLLRKWA